MNTADLQENQAYLEEQDNQALSQGFLQAAAIINTLPATKEYFNYAILPEMSLATHLNSDERLDLSIDKRLELCLKRYLLIQHGFALSGNTLSAKELIIMNSVAQTFAAKIAHDGPECKTAEAEY